MLFCANFFVCAHDGIGPTSVIYKEHRVLNYVSYSQLSFSLHVVFFFSHHWANGLNNVISYLFIHLVPLT